MTSKLPFACSSHRSGRTCLFCYIYGDYFGLYQLGTLQSMLEGHMAP